MDMALLQQYGPYLGWALIAAGAVLGVYEFRHKLPSLGTLTAWLPKGQKAKPDPKVPLNKCADCIQWCIDNNCPEGAEYFKAGLVHFYHSH